MERLAKRICNLNFLCLLELSSVQGRGEIDSYKVLGLKWVKTKIN